MSRIHPAGGLLLSGLLLAASGCEILSSPQREFVSQESVLKAAVRSAHYDPDPSWYRPVHAEINEDLITFYYQGVLHPGDRAWVTIFSQKSTEQAPEEILDLERLLAAIGQGKEEFKVRSRGRLSTFEPPVKIATYRFRAGEWSAAAKGLEGGGSAAIVRVDRRPAPLIYHLNVVNDQGDRPAIGPGELEPLLAAIQR